MRVESSLKNFIYGFVSQAISSMLSFAIRCVLIYTLGAEAVSLNGLFTEVIAMLSLAEMGVGAAIVYDLYEPLLHNDEKRLAALMNFFRQAYRLIALAIFTLGLLLLPWVHLLVHKMEIDLGYLRLIYFLFLLQTVSSYLFSYKGALLGADQKTYVVSLYVTCIRTLFVGLSIGFLFLTKNYITYLLLQILSNIAVNIAVSIQADRRYPFLKRKERLPVEDKKKIFANVKYLFIGVLSGKITNSTDNILISTMVGTLHIGAYSCYTMIIHAMNCLLNQLRQATTGSIGNLVAEGDYKHAELVLRRLTFITFCPAILAAVGIYTVSSPFVLLLYGEEYLLPVSVIFICVFNFLIYFIKNPLWQMMGVSGLFAQDKNISITGDVLNLLVSIVLGKRWGIAGILLGTTCTLVVQHVLKIRLLFRDFLHLESKRYVVLIFKETVFGVICMLAAQAVCTCLPAVNLYGKVLLYGICSEVIATAIIFVVFHSSEEFAYTVETAKTICRERIFKGKSKKITKQ